MSRAPDLPPFLVLFDGVCGLCDRTVQFLLEHDHDALFSFAPLQGETAARVRARHPELDGVDSVVFIERERESDGEGDLEHEHARVSVRSAAVLRMLGHLRAPYRYAAALAVLPSWLLDGGYDLVASARYRIFGKLEVCRVPSADVASRFLP